METDKSIMPEIVLFPRLARAAEFIGKLFPCFSHEVPYAGASELLDKELDYGLHE